MSERRARRPAVDYSDFNFDDDDDFVDSSSSSSSRGGSQEKSKKESGKEKRKKERKETDAPKAQKNDENASKGKESKEPGKKAKKELKEVDLNGGGVTRTLESFLSSPSRRGGERKSLDDRRFERELEMAMKLSKQVGEQSDPEN